MRRSFVFFVISLSTALVTALVACGGDDTVVPLDGSAHDATSGGAEGGANGSVDAGSGRDASFDVTPPPPGDFCGLPGSLVFTNDTSIQIPGNAGDPDLSWLTLPNGFCAHYYASVPSARQVRVAPGGEVFVASPSRSTAGGAPTGVGAIVVVPDDNKDGYGDPSVHFQDTSVADAGTGGVLSDVEGMLFANGFFYYQDGTTIQRVPYTTGTRQNASTQTQMIDVNVYVDVFHWPKTLDMADDGTIYVTNGSTDGEWCLEPHIVQGAILAVDGTANGKVIAHGFRNPQYMRCQHGHNHCFVNELTKDFSSSVGGREKLLLFGPGQDWGFPCCASKDLPFPVPPPEKGEPPWPSKADCSMVQSDQNAFIVGSTPFGLDFEPGLWPTGYQKNVFIAMHGAVGSWIGARVVTIPTDPTSGLPFPATNQDGGVSGPMTDFITGWDDSATQPMMLGSRAHGRPSDVTFGADGRMFVANDFDGTILWVAPIGLKHP
jgi:glucose/arabinose dehydrogenase